MVVWLIIIHNATYIMYDLWCIDFLWRCNWFLTSFWNEYIYEFLLLQVLRPQIEPIIYRDLFLFRTLASFLNGISLEKLGCNAELIVDEFGEKLLEELDYTLVLLQTSLVIDRYPHNYDLKLSSLVYTIYYLASIIIMITVVVWCHFHHSTE